MNVFLYLIPVIANVILIPLWIIMDNSWKLSVFEIVCNTFIVPLYLIIVIAKTMPKSTIKTSIIKSIIAVFILVADSAINYLNWGISTGLFYTPDIKTIAILKSQFFVSLIILTVGLCVAFISQHKGT